MYTDKESPSMPGMIKTGSAKVSLLDEYMDKQVTQSGFLVETMRRVEEAADRLSGSVPSSDPAEITQESAPVGGRMADLYTFHRDRQEMIRRIADAMDRIERII